jgi:hypothetical protein
LKHCTGFISIFCVLLLPVLSSASELKTRFTRLEFDNPELLHKFNSRVRLGLSNSLGKSGKQLSIDNVVTNKVDLIYGRVQEILDMHPAATDLSIVLFPSVDFIQSKYQDQYSAHVSYIAYYSPQSNTVYLAVDKVNVRVLAHELAHVVIHHFFNNEAPESVHELLAQHVEKQFYSPKKRLK